MLFTLIETIHCAAFVFTGYMLAEKNLIGIGTGALITLILGRFIKNVQHQVIVEKITDDVLAVVRTAVEKMRNKQPDQKLQPDVGKELPTDIIKDNTDNKLTPEAEQL